MNKFHVGSNPTFRTQCFLCCVINNLYSDNECEIVLQRTTSVLKEKEKKRMPFFDSFEIKKVFYTFVFQTVHAIFYQYVVNEAL